MRRAAGTLRSSGFGSGGSGWKRRRGEGRRRGKTRGLGGVGRGCEGLRAPNVLVPLATRPGCAAAAGPPFPSHSPKCGEGSEGLFCFFFLLPSVAGSDSFPSCTQVVTGTFPVSRGSNTHKKYGRIWQSWKMQERFLHFLLPRPTPVPALPQALQPPLQPRPVLPAKEIRETGCALPHWCVTEPPGGARLAGRGRRRGDGVQLF